MLVAKELKLIDWIEVTKMVTPWITVADNVAAKELTAVWNTLIDLADEAVSEKNPVALLERIESILTAVEEVSVCVTILTTPKALVAA